MRWLVVPGWVPTATGNSECDSSLLFCDVVAGFAFVFRALIFCDIFVWCEDCLALHWQGWDVLRLAPWKNGKEDLRAMTVRFVLWSSRFGDVSPCFFFISDNATWVPELHLTRLVLCQWFRVDRAMSVAPMLAFVVASFGTIGEDTVQAFKESAQHWFAIEWGGKGGGDLRRSHRFW